MGGAGRTHDPSPPGNAERKEPFGGAAGARGASGEEAGAGFREAQLERGSRTSVLDTGRGAEPCGAGDRAFLERPAICFSHQVLALPSAQHRV